MRFAKNESGFGHRMENRDARGQIATDRQLGHPGRQHDISYMEKIHVREVIRDGNENESIR